MKVLLSIYLLFTLLCPVAALQCIGCRSFLGICYQRTKEHCKAKTDTCLNSNMNSSLYSKVRLRPEEGFFSTECMESKFCFEGDYSFTSAKDYFKMISQCCRTDFCNSEPIPLTVQEPNGFQCPGGKYYKPDNSTVICHNNEKKCIRIKGVIKWIPENKDINFRGCATEDFCDWAEKFPQQLIHLMHLEPTNVECSDALLPSDQDNPTVGERE